ncbi:AAA family ATPase [Geodermatophilus sp. SYSU D00703]
MTAWTDDPWSSTTVPEDWDPVESARLIDQYRVEHLGWDRAAHERAREQLRAELDAEAQRIAAEEAAELDVITAEIDARRREVWRDFDFTDKEYKAPGSDEWNRTVRGLATTEQERRHPMRVHAEREARGEFLPLRDGATDVDLDGIVIGKRLYYDDEGKPHTEDCYTWNGEEFGPIRPDLEARVKLEQAVVDASHASTHMDYRVEFCTPCELRSRGWTAEDAAASDGSFEKDIEEEVVRPRLRRHLWRGKLPVVRGLQVLDGPEFLDAAELLAQESPGWLINLLIPHRSVGFVVAAHSKGKSFLVDDIAFHVAAGLDEWHGRESEDANLTGRAVVVKGEDAAASGQRLAALLAHHDMTADDLEDRLLVRPGAVNLFTGGAEFDSLLRLCRELRPELIVLDTLQTCTVGADHNSAADMAVVGDRLRTLQRASGGVVLVVAHAGKNGTDARGSSAIEADADFVLRVAEWNPAGAMRVDVAKLKNGETGSFTLGVRKVAGSLVLTSPGERETPAVTWSSSSNENRVLTALKVLHPTGPASESAILAVVNDSDHPQMNRGTAYRVLSRLVERGDVVQPKPSVRAFLLATEEGQR